MSERIVVAVITCYFPVVLLVLPRGRLNNGDPALGSSLTFRNCGLHLVDFNPILGVP